MPLKLDVLIIISCMMCHYLCGYSRVKCAIIELVKEIWVTTTLFFMRYRILVVDSTSRDIKCEFEDLGVVRALFF